MAGQLQLFWCSSFTAEVVKEQDGSGVQGCSTEVQGCNGQLGYSEVISSAVNGIAAEFGMRGMPHLVCYGGLYASLSKATFTVVGAFAIFAALLLLDDCRDGAPGG